MLCETPSASANPARLSRSSWRRAPDELAERRPPGGVDDERGRAQRGHVGLDDPQELGDRAEQVGARRRPTGLPSRVGGLRHAQDLDDGGLGEPASRALVPQPLRQRGEVGARAVGADHSEVSSARTAMSRASRSAEGCTAPFSHRRIVSSLTPSWAASSRRRLPARTRDASRWAPRRGDQTISSVTSADLLVVSRIGSHPAVVRLTNAVSLERSPSLVNPLRGSVTTQRDIKAAEPPHHVCAAWGPHAVPGTVMVGRLTHAGSRAHAVRCTGLPSTRACQVVVSRGVAVEPVADAPPAGVRLGLRVVQAASQL